MKKIFWSIMQGLILAILIGALPLGYLLDRPGIGWLVFIAVIILHLVELGITIPLAKQRQYPVPATVIRTMLFGFTWWVPWKAPQR